MAPRIAYTADRHLGRRLLSFREEDEKKRTRERLGVVARMLQLANHNPVHAVLCAGDLFDSPEPDRQQGEGLASHLKRHSREERVNQASEEVAKLQSLRDRISAVLEPVEQRQQVASAQVELDRQVGKVAACDEAQAHQATLAGELERARKLASADAARELRLAKRKFREPRTSLQADIQTRQRESERTSRHASERVNWPKQSANGKRQTQRNKLQTDAAELLAKAQAQEQQVGSLGAQGLGVTATKPVTQ